MSFIIYIDAEVGFSNEEDKKLVTEDYLGLTDGDDVDVLDHSLVPFLNTSIKIKEAAENIYFIPDGSPGKNLDSLIYCKLINSKIKMYFNVIYFFQINIKN